MDLNGDGHHDILSGSYSRMSTPMAGLFQVLWGQPDGSFKKAETLLGTDGEPLIIPIESDDQMTQNICTRPTAVDWDADGDLDLVVGNFAGSFYVFEGQGEGKFSPQPKPVMSGDQPLRISGAHSDPFVVDWDRDGDLDLVSGSSNGGVHWAENTAGEGKPPELQAFQALIPAGPSFTYGMPLKETDLNGPTTGTRVWVDDINSDGKLDILVGDNVTLVEPVGDLSEQEFKAKFAAWQDAVREASAALSGPDVDAEQRTEASKRFNELYQKRTEFMKEDRTGFVWLYLQK